jgi:nitrile hydratase
MNGIHDMGGMHGMGPLEPEKSEPVFHAAWEGRVFALNRAMGAWRKWNDHASRHAKELIPAADYLRMSYYERWFAGLVELLISKGFVSRGEIARGRPEPGGLIAKPALTAAQVPAYLAAQPNTRIPGPSSLFQVGQRVRARRINPAGHTRLPRYARGRVGTIERDHGVFDLPDRLAHFLDPKPQHLYSVRFDSRELWGDQACSPGAVYLDLFDDYLEPLDERS